jgi:hypothetical protein
VAHRCGPRPGHKAQVFGFGLNWQHCHRMLFLGLGDSYEPTTRPSAAAGASVRRKTRRRAVVVISDVEGAIAENVKRKEADAINRGEHRRSHA